MRKGFLTRIVYANGLWLTGIFLLVLSVLGNLLYPRLEAPTLDLVVLQDLEIRTWMDIFAIPWLNSLFRFLMVLAAGLFLQILSTEYRLIRTRSYFPFFLFCVFAATIFPALPLDGSVFACFLCCWSFFRLFEACDSSINRSVFDATFLLSLASLLQPRLMVILPVYWLVMGVIQVFSFKSFMASLLGFVSIFWLFAGVSFLFNDYSFLLNYYKDLISFQLIDFSGFTSAQMAYVFLLGLLMISAMLSFWPRQNMDKLRTRNYLNSILLLWFSFMFLWLFSGNEMGLLLMLFSLSSLMIAHFFSLTDTRFSRSLFFVFMGMSATVYFLL